MTLHLDDLDVVVVSQDGDDPRDDRVAGRQKHRTVHLELDGVVDENLLRRQHRQRAAMLRWIHGRRTRDLWASVVNVRNRVGVGVGATVRKFARVLRASIDRILHPIAIGVRTTIRRATRDGRTPVHPIGEAVLILIGRRRRRWRRWATVFLWIRVWQAWNREAGVHGIDHAIGILIERFNRPRVRRRTDVLPAVDFAPVPVLAGATNVEQRVIPFLAHELDFLRDTAAAKRRQPDGLGARNATR